MAKAMDKNTIQQMKKNKEIKEQWTNFVRIELGKILNRILSLIFINVY